VQDSAVSVLDWDTTNKGNKYMVDNPFLVRTPSTAVVDMQGSSRCLSLSLLALRSLQSLLSFSVKPRLHDTTCCHTGCQPGKCLYTRYNRLSNPLSNRLSDRFDNQLYRVYKHSTGCQTRLTTGLTTGCIVYTTGCQTGPGLTTGCIV